MTTSLSMQVVFDCRDPHGLADFWAEAFGYDVEIDEAFVQRMLGEGRATDDDVTRHRGRLVWKTAAACSRSDGALPRLLFQTVPEPKSVKNRVHIDVHVGGDVDEAVARLVSLGATRLWDGRQGPFSWVTMADPEGNEFCVT